MARRQSRELAFILLFEQSFGTGSMDDVIGLAREARGICPDAFACELAKGTAQHLSELDSQIEQNAAHWKRDRISKVSLAVLRLALYEMRYMPQTPASVAINEAVELAKKYGDAEEFSFVNGVLGAIARDSVAQPTAPSAV